MTRVLFLFVAACALLCASCSRPGVSEILEDCEKLAQAGKAEDWKKVRERLETVRRDYKIPDNEPNAAALHNFYVMSLIKTANGNWDEAAREADNVQRKYPTNFLTNYHLGKVKMEQGDPTGAYSYLVSAHSLRSDHVPTLSLLLEAVEKRGANDSDAENYFRQAEGMAEFSSDAKFHNLKALWQVRLAEDTQITSERRDHYIKAIKSFHSAARLDETSPIPYRNMAVVYEKLGMARAALKYYKMYKKLMDKDPEMHRTVQRRMAKLLKERRMYEARRER